jgi:hypothetical protein
MKKFKTLAICIALATLMADIFIMYMFERSPLWWIILYTINFGGFLTAYYNYETYKESKIKRWDKNTKN